MSIFTSIAGFAARPVLTAAAPYLIGAAVLAGGGYIAYQVHHQRQIGRDEVKAEWDLANAEQTRAAFKQSEANARETARRLAAQEENQRAQNEELAAAHAAADRNARDAERVRNQSATAAEQWSHTLRNSPTSADLAAAVAAIAVLTDVRGRLDQHASVLASYATAARAAGLKCERDYDSLSGAVKP